MDIEKTYWQKFINYSNLLIREEILQKRLLFVGFMDFFYFFKEFKKDITFLSLKSIVEELVNNKWINTLLKLEPDKDTISAIDYNFIFIINSEFIDEAGKNLKWSSKISSQFWKSITDIPNLEKSIMDSNNEILYNFLMEEVREDKIIDRIDLLFSARPFMKDYDCADNINDYIEKFRISNFTKGNILNGFYAKKKQEAANKRRTKYTEVIDNAFKELFYVEMSELDNIFKKNEISYPEGKNILETGIDEYIIISYLLLYKKEVSKKVDSTEIKILYTNNKEVEILQDNLVIDNVSKLFTEYEKEIDELLKQLLIPEVKANFQRNISVINDKETLLIIRKDTFPALLNRLLAKIKTSMTGKTEEELRVLFKILAFYYKKSSQNKINIPDNQYLLGFSSIDHLAGVLKNFQDLLLSRDNIKILEKKIELAKIYETSTFFLKIISLLFSTPSKEMEKNLESQKAKYSEIRSGLSGRIGGKEYLGADSIIKRIIGELKKNSINLFEVTALKNSVENNPNQLIKYLEGNTQRFLNDSLNNAEWKKTFVKNVKIELEKHYEEMKKNR